VPGVVGILIFERCRSWSCLRDRAVASLWQDAISLRGACFWARLACSGPPCGASCCRKGLVICNPNPRGDQNPNPPSSPFPLIAQLSFTPLHHRIVNTSYPGFQNPMGHFPGVATDNTRLKKPAVHSTHASGMLPKQGTWYVQKAIPLDL
jgi:hypothetical protein